MPLAASEIHHSKATGAATVTPSSFTAVMVMSMPSVVELAARATVKEAGTPGSTASFSEAPALPTLETRYCLTPRELALVATSVHLR